MAGQRKTVVHSDIIILPLSPKDHNLLTSETCFFSTHPSRRLRLAPVRHGRIVHKMTYEELEELADSIAEASIRTSQNQICMELDRLLEQIEQILNGYLIDEVVPKPFSDDLGLAMVRLAVGGQPAEGAFPSELTTLMEKQAGRYEESSSTADIEQVMARVEEHLHRPLAELDGLTPAQFSRLINDDWHGGSLGVVKLTNGLSPADLEVAPILSRARTMLRAVAETGKVKSTLRGNLPRWFVSEMVSRMALPPGYIESILRSKKVLNEKDVLPLHVVRVLLELSGCLYLKDGYFQTTRKGITLSSERRTQDLYTLLFKTHFRELNLSYLDDMPDAPLLQNVMAYSLYSLSILANEWRHPEQLARKLSLQREVVGAPYTFWDEKVHQMLISRLLRPLIGFGLLEKQLLPSRETLDWLKPFEVRRSPLFSKFLSFDLK